MALSSQTKAELANLLVGPVLWEAPLEAWTTFRIGGPAEALITVEDDAELIKLLRFCSKHEVDWIVLGRGSNVLAPDDGYPGIVITLGSGFKYVQWRQESRDQMVLIEAGAAYGLSPLVDWCGSEGFTGMEFCAGIPGSVGGAAIMNAGAHGDDIGRILHRATVVSAVGKQRLSRDTLRFSYRRWLDMYQWRKTSVVTALEFTLSIGRSTEIMAKIKSLRKQRWQRQPTGMPNAGCCFKNPGQTSAGELIDRAGLKGLRIGDAEVSEKHANFIVNRGRASATEVRQLMAKVQARVAQKYGINLEPEVHIL